MVSNKLLFVCFTSIAFIYFTMKSTVKYLDSRLRTLDPGSKCQDSNSLCNVLEEGNLLSPGPSPLRRINGHLWTVRENWRNVGEGGAPRINWHPIQGEWQYVLSFHDTETVKSSGCKGATRVFKLNPELYHRVTYLTISCCSQFVGKCVQWKAILCKRQSCLLIEKIKIFQRFLWRHETNFRQETSLGCNLLTSDSRL